jgi:uncharacterized protein
MRPWSARLQQMMCLPSARHSPPAPRSTRRANGVTPLEFAIGIGHKRAAAELIRYNADPNLKDAEGDGAVTLAVNGDARDPELLRLVHDAGGDPNTRKADGNPVMWSFLSDANLDAITYLHSRGASLDDAMANGQPMIVYVAYSIDWDVVWRLIELVDGSARRRSKLVFI